MERIGTNLTSAMSRCCRKMLGGNWFYYRGAFSASCQGVASLIGEQHNHLPIC
jgi:hypothetical protein